LHRESIDMFMIVSSCEIELIDLTLQAYSVTKAAQLHLSKSLAMVMAPSIRVNSVSPGFMETVAYHNFPVKRPH
jgi:NAD(P)-dependent dehydrogenase (short-subunit alcohol dehydrogenase family)